MLGMVIAVVRSRVLGRKYGNQHAACLETRKEEKCDRFFDVWLSQASQKKKKVQFKSKIVDVNSSLREGACGVGCFFWVSKTLGGNSIGIEMVPGNDLFKEKYLKRRRMSE
jgi:hypothetical protein